MRSWRVWRAVWAATIALVPVAARAQATGEITGRVTDSASGAPIAAAQVQVGGTALGAVAGDDGRFRIASVPPGTHQVTVRRIGYRSVTREVAVPDGAGATLDVALAATIATLDQQVITATGASERKREDGSNIGTLAVDSVPLAAVSTVADVMSARLPGVSVSLGSGTVGTGSRIHIRGANSVSLSNDPLLVIDGVRADNTSASEPADIGTGEGAPSRLNDLNPDDIEDIQVIKGPAATALYGTAAANGVVQIRTKQGRQGRARFDAYGEQGALHQPADFPANFAQIGTLAGGGRTTNCNLIAQGLGVCTPTSDSLVSLNPLQRYSPFRVGAVANYGMSVSGGAGPATTYYVSGAFEREDGTYINNVRRNLSTRANLHTQLRDNLDLAVSAGYVDGGLTRPQNGDQGTGIILGGLQGSAFDDPIKHGYAFYPLNQVEQFQTLQDLHRLSGSATANFLPVPWLTLTGVAGEDDVDRSDVQYLPTGAIPENPALAIGFREVEPTHLFTYTANGSASARYTLRPTLSATSTLGASFYKTATTSSSASGSNLSPGTQSLQGASSLFTVGESHETIVTVGYLAQQQFAWRDRVYLSGAVRTDRNSAFGFDFKRVYYPSVNLSWVTSDEPFFPRTDVVSSLRLRAAYGESGQNPRFRQALSFYSPVPVAINGTDAPGVTVGGTGNGALKPEQSRELEGGFDAGLFRERVNVELTVYNKITSDALVQQPLPPSIGGAATRFVNLGEVRNRGLELLVNARVVDAQPVVFDLGLNGSANANKLISLGSGIPPLTFLLGYIQDRAGSPLGGYWAPTIQHFADANHDGIIEPNEITMSPTPQYVGTPFPLRELSVTPRVTLFRLVRLSALFDYRGGQKLWDLDAAVRCALALNCQAIQDRRTPLADQADAVAGAAFGDLGTYIKDASFWKWRELAVSIDAPVRWPRAVGLTSGTLTFAGRNLATWTRYKGLDPEANTFPATGPSSLELAVTPQVRYYTVRLTLGW